MTSYELGWRFAEILMREIEEKKLKLTKTQKTGMYLLLWVFAAGIVIGWMLGLVHSAAGRAHAITMEQKGW